MPNSPLCQDYAPSRTIDPEAALLIDRISKIQRGDEDLGTWLKSFADGQSLMRKDTDWNRRCMLALLDRTLHWPQNKRISPASEAPIPSGRERHMIAVGP